MKNETPVKEPRPQSAFVIGPIGDKDASADSPARRTYEEAIQVWEEVIIPACEAFGLKVTRADTIARPGEITDQIFRELRDADVVVADLTGANPNVMYELGLRHTTGRLTIQIGERERLPFDVSIIRTILFKRTPAGLIDAGKRLSQALAGGLQHGGDPVAATRIWFESAELAAPTEGLRTDDDEETGFLEKLADMEEGMQAIAPILDNTVQIINEITLYVEQGTAETQRANEQGGGAAARVVVANRLASRLEDSASRLEVTVGEHARTLRRIDPGMTYLLQRVIDEPELRPVAAEFIPSIRGLIDSAEGALPRTKAFRDSLREAGVATRPLKRVTHRIATTLQLFIDSTQVVLNWHNFLDQIPPADGGVVA